MSMNGLQVPSMPALAGSQVTAPSLSTGSEKISFHAGSQNLQTDVGTWHDAWRVGGPG